METFIPILIGNSDLTLGNFLLLGGVSFLGSGIAAALGLGGGLLVLATMALVLPPTVLVPMHGMIQLGSNLGRVALMTRHVMTSILPAFLIGTILGAAVGAQVVVSLPTALLQGILAAFVLYSTWAPKFQAHNPGKRTFFTLGTVSSFITMFIGATGPLVAPFAAAACSERKQVVATHAALMTIQHTLKIVAFGMIGFSFAPYLSLLIFLLTAGFLGTLVGRTLLHRLPEHIFRMGLKAVLTILALRLFYGAVTA